MAGTRRRKLSPHRIGLPETALEAWRAGDKLACNQALDIWPCEVSPFTADDPEPPEYMLEEERRGVEKSYGAASWRRAWELRQALIEAAGLPGLVGRHGRPLVATLSERRR